MEMEQIDIVIPLGNGSKWNNNELKYALRSIEKFVKNYKNIYIIGKCPDFLNKVDNNDSCNGKIKNIHINNYIIHIPFGDTSYRTDNIRNKILEACRIEEISDNFFFTNDDIFFLKDINIIDYPYYYENGIIDTIKIKNFDSYSQALDNTYLALIRQEHPTKYFDIHYPIIYNKEKFKQIINSNNWNKRYGFTIKSLYSNTLHIEGIKNRDLKIRQPVLLTELNEILENKELFSIDDEAINGTLKMKLEELYPNKSKYEK